MGSDDKRVSLMETAEAPLPPQDNASASSTSRSETPDSAQDGVRPKTSLGLYSSPDVFSPSLPQKPYLKPPSPRTSPPSCPFPDPRTSSPLLQVPYDIVSGEIFDTVQGRLAWSLRMEDLSYPARDIIDAVDSIATTQRINGEMETRRQQGVRVSHSPGSEDGSDTGHQQETIEPISPFQRRYKRKFDAVIRELRQIDTLAYARSLGYFSRRVPRHVQEQAPIANDPYTAQPSLLCTGMYPQPLSSITVPRDRVALHLPRRRYTLISSNYASIRARDAYNHKYGGSQPKSQAISLQPPLSTSSVRQQKADSGIRAIQFYAGRHFTVDIPYYLLLLMPRKVVECRHQSSQRQLPPYLPTRTHSPQRQLPPLPPQRPKTTNLTSPFQPFVSLKQPLSSGPAVLLGPSHRGLHRLGPLQLGETSFDLSPVGSFYLEYLNERGRTTEAEAKLSQLAETQQNTSKRSEGQRPTCESSHVERSIVSPPSKVSRSDPPRLDESDPVEPVSGVLSSGEPRLEERERREPEPEYPPPMEPELKKPALEETAWEEPTWEAYTSAWQTAGPSRGRKAAIKTDAKKTTSTDLFTAHHSKSKHLKGHKIAPRAPETGPLSTIEKPQVGGRSRIKGRQFASKQLKTKQASVSRKSEVEQATAYRQYEGEHYSAYERTKAEGAGFKQRRSENPEPIECQSKSPFNPFLSDKDIEEFSVSLPVQGTSTANKTINDSSAVSENAEDPTSWSRIQSEPMANETFNTSNVDKNSEQINLSSATQDTRTGNQRSNEPGVSDSGSSESSISFRSSTIVATPLRDTESNVVSWGNEECVLGDPDHVPRRLVRIIARLFDIEEEYLSIPKGSQHDVQVKWNGSSALTLHASNNTKIALTDRKLQTLKLLKGAWSRCNSTALQIQAWIDDLRTTVEQITFNQAPEPSSIEESLSPILTGLERFGRLHKSRTSNIQIEADIRMKDLVHILKDLENRREGREAERSQRFSYTQRDAYIRLHELQGVLSRWVRTISDIHITQLLQDLFRLATLRGPLSEVELLDISRERIIIPCEPKNGQGQMYQPPPIKFAIARKLESLAKICASRRKEVFVNPTASLEWKYHVFAALVDIATHGGEEACKARLFAWAKACLIHRRNTILETKRVNIPILIIMLTSRGTFQIFYMLDHKTRFEVGKLAEIGDSESLRGWHQMVEVLGGVARWAAKMYR